MSEVQEPIESNKILQREDSVFKKDLDDNIHREYFDHVVVSP